MRHVHSIDAFCFIVFHFKHARAARMGTGKEDRIINEWAAHFKVKPEVVRDGREQYENNDSKHYENIRDN